MAGTRSPTRVRANLERVRERIGDAVEICAAIKYVRADDLPALAEAGITLVGENRAQDLAAKQDAHGDLFEWDFIGALQSRKVKDVAPRVRADPFGRVRVGARPAREAPGEGDPDSGERGGGGGEGRGRAGGARRTSLPVARCPLPAS